ncbi:MAG TPA: hypothetical protein ENK27_04660 [Desulfobulbus sp.]|nr:hypothetical protein [Desulfobulbus sp.]
MTDIRQTMEESLALYRQLQRAMEGIEKRLPLLDVTATVRATEELEQLHQRILAMDRQLLRELRPENVEAVSGLMERRRTLLTEVLEQNRSLLPKLKSRLAGYRNELLKIRSGITSMQGYQHRTNIRGGRINTVN